MDDIPDSPENKISVALNPTLPIINSFPALLQHGSKATYDHAVEFYKGFIMTASNGAAHFLCCRKSSPKEES